MHPLSEQWWYTSWRNDDIRERIYDWWGWRFGGVPVGIVDDSTNHRFDVALRHGGDCVRRVRTNSDGNRCAVQDKHARVAEDFAARIGDALVGRVGDRASAKI